MIHQAATSPGVLMVSSPRKRKERELEEAAQALDCEQAARAAESIAAGWSQAGERSPEVLRHRDERWPTFSAACRSVAMSVSTCVGWQVCSVGTPLRDGERLPVRRIACLRARRCIAVWVCWCAGSRISSSKLISPRSTRRRSCRWSLFVPAGTLVDRSDRRALATGATGLVGRGLPKMRAGWNGCAAGNRA